MMLMQPPRQRLRLRLGTVGELGRYEYRRDHVDREYFVFVNGEYEGFPSELWHSSSAFG
jgi:hypothetical protein